MDLKPFLKRHSKNGDRANQDRSAIKSHPLFPILEYLFFKCEHSTSSLSNTSTKVDMEEMLAMVVSNSDGQWRTGDNELDQLMLRAIQVLRIQLLELEKVEELCKDFCARYITCLKGKVTQEMLLGWSDVGDDGSCSPPSPSSPFIFNGTDISESQRKGPSAIVATMQTPNGQVSIPLLIPLLITPSMTVTSTLTSSDTRTVINPSSNKTSTNMLPSSNLVAQTESAKLLRSPDHATETDSVSDDKIQKTVDSGTATKGKRGSLPRKAVDILRSWLFQNIRHPYPSEEEKRDLCTQSGLNLLQVNNWFINARRRILQPLLDGATSTSTFMDPTPSPQQIQHSNPSMRAPSPECTRVSTRKRNLVGHRSTGRYWPDSLIRPPSDATCDLDDQESSASEETDLEKKRRGEVEGITKENR